MNKRNRNQIDSTFFLGDEKTPDESIEEAQTGVTRESFEQRFRRFFAEVLTGTDPAQKLIGQVTAEQMDGFFTIADHYMRELAGTPGTREKRKLLADYRRCEKLMKGTENGINELRAYVQQFLTVGRSRTGPVAEHIIGRLDSFAKELDSDFYDIRHSIDMQKGRVPQFLVKNLQDEFVMNLEVFIDNEFSTLDRKNRNILIAAASAGAGVLTQEELESGEDVVGRIPMKVSRAKKHKKTFIDNQPQFEAFDPAGRVFPVLRARKKKQKATGGEGKNI